MPGGAGMSSSRSASRTMPPSASGTSSSSYSIAPALSQETNVDVGIEDARGRPDQRRFVAAVPFNDEPSSRDEHNSRRYGETARNRNGRARYRAGAACLRQADATLPMTNPQRAVALHRDEMYVRTICKTRLTLYFLRERFEIDICRIVAKHDHVRIAHIHEPRGDLTVHRERAYLRHPNGNAHQILRPSFDDLRRNPSGNGIENDRVARVRFIEPAGGAT